MAHAHHHDCGHGHAHSHHHGGKGLLLATLLTLGFAGVEAVAGAWSGSLALIGDAGHMVNDGVALALAAAAAWVARRPPSHRHTYGWGLAMLALVVAILVEAVQRFQEPAPVAGPMVMAVAVVGLLMNAVVAWMLSRGESSLNTRAALLHVLGDMLGSVAAIASGAIVYFTGWKQADPLLAAGIALLISVSSLRLMREALHALMEGTPPHISAAEVGAAMEQVSGVLGVYDLHVWTVGDGEVMLSAHLQVADLAAWPQTLAGLRQVLQQRWHIRHVTLQPETGPIEPLHRPV